MLVFRLKPFLPFARRYLAEVGSNCSIWLSQSPLTAVYIKGVCLYLFSWTSRLLNSRCILFNELKNTWSLFIVLVVQWYQCWKGFHPSLAYNYSKYKFSDNFLRSITVMKFWNSFPNLKIKSWIDTGHAFPCWSTTSLTSFTLSASNNDIAPLSHVCESTRKNQYRYDFFSMFT